MSSVALVSLFQVVALILDGLIAVKLLRCGLYRRYRVFFAYLIFMVPYGIWFLLLDTSSNLYQKSWVVTEPILWAFYITLIVELYGLILEKHKGLYTLGRWVMYAGLSISTLISALALLPHITPAQRQITQVMPYIWAGERAVNLSLALFILLILLFLSTYPVPLSRNVITHAAVYSIFFLSSTLWVVVRTLFGLRLSDLMNLIVMAISCLCLTAWLILLSPKGEEVRSGSVLHFSQEHEDRVLQTLDALNATMLKISRK